MFAAQAALDKRLERGYQLGEYALLEQIGVGGEGAVWSSWDNRRRQVAALKIMPAMDRDPVISSQISKDFERQVHLLASLEHPNILPLYEFGVTDEYYYFAMKYSSGGSLYNQLLAGPIPLEKALPLIAQICSALDNLHRRAVVHRDIKPSNILLDGKMRVYLADFGIAKQLAQETAPLHTGRGTSAYAPYEQHISSVVTPQSDIYSLGVLIFEMLTGKLPFGGTTSLATQQFQGSEQLPAVETIVPTLPPTLSQALRQMTALDFMQRPASAGAAYDLLVEALPAKLQAQAIELKRPLPRITERERLFQDAQHLLNLFLPNWQAESEEFPASLTHVALIDAAYGQSREDDPKKNDQIREFMLRGALTYGYRLDYWWQQVAYPWRLQVCQACIANEADEPVTRVLTKLSSEPSSIELSGTFSPEALERLLDLALNATGWSLRNNALKILARAAPAARQWQPARIGQGSEVKLAMLAMSQNAQALPAAQLIGQIRSETAVSALVEAQDQMEETQFLEIMNEIRTTAGSLPASVPAQVRWRVLFNLLRTRLLDDREGLSWSRALIGLAVGGLASLFMLLGVLIQPSAQMRDVLLESYPVSDIVTIVEVNDDSLERYGRWDSWSRSLHADLIDKLSAAGAKAIVFDFIFSGQTADDAQLQAAMARAGNVVQPVLGQGDAFHQPDGTVRYEAGVLPQPELLAATAAVGHTNILHDPDGFVRRVPTVAAIEEKPRLNLALAALQVYLGLTGDVDPPRPVDGRLDIAGRQLPVGDLGELTVYYAGPPAQPGETTYQMVSYEDVLDQTISATLFQDKIVLIGITATAEPDRYLTPVSRGRPMYGVEILANVIESVWSRRFITLPGEMGQALILLLLGILTGLVCTRPWAGLLLAGALGVVYFLLASWLFDLTGVMLDLLFPFLTIGFSYATVTAYRFSVEARQRREIMQIFQARVNPEVAQATIDAVKKGEINLSGRVQEVSVVLADIRGYGTFAELHEPQEVMDAINALRQLFVETVFSLDGTVAQFEGDQGLAIFNAPLPQPDHAWRAVEAALLIREKIDRFHESLAAGDPQRVINFGYGAYTGRAIVGHIGTADRPTYSALGNAVNIASQLAKTANPSQVIIGESSYESVRDLVESTKLTPVIVKGEPEPIVAYAVVRGL